MVWEETSEIHQLFYANMKSVLFWFEHLILNNYELFTPQ